MSGWNKISLFKFQQIQRINQKKDMPDIDKVLFSTCEVFNLTEYQLDQMNPVKASRLIGKMTNFFNEPLNVEAVKKIGKYRLNYEPSIMTFGQYRTLGFYISNDSVLNGHKILATVAEEKKHILSKRKYDPINQDIRSEFFLHQPITKIIGSIKRLTDAYILFNKRFNWLFGVDTDNAKEVEGNLFHKRYGWDFSATLVADHCRISLDAAYALPVVEAFNYLGYLKAKAKYDEQQINKK